MIQTLMKNWWLLALCGVLDGILAFLNLSIFTQGPLTPQSTVADICRLAVAAGACTMAAGLWSSGRGRSWLLALNGVAFSAYGLIPILWTGPLSFRLFALLTVIMALSVGMLELTTARTLRRRIADQWLLGVAGVASAGFGLAFLALALRWITLQSALHSAIFLWFGSYFGFSAICMLLLGLRLNSLRTAIPPVSGRTLATG